MNGEYAALGDGLFAKISTTRGDVIVKLEYEKTPLTVTNFAALAEGKMDAAGGKPFYDGLTFHRVIDDFMIQGGDPEGSGSGGPGYRFPDEFDASLRHDRAGVLSMANAGPNTNGSQFFITHKETPWLDDMHSVFGFVVKGQDVVNSIKQGDKINSIKIIRNGGKAEAFTADQKSFDALLSDYYNLEKRFPGTKKTPSGIYYTVLKEGSGSKPVKGDTVSINYKLTLLSGKVVDDSARRGAAFDFTLGKDAVIPGWAEAVADMKRGEKRLVIIPPELGYGERAMRGGRGEVIIPAMSFLVFEIELLK